MTFFDAFFYFIDLQNLQNFLFLLKFLCMHCFTKVFLHEILCHMFHRKTADWIQLHLFQTLLSNSIVLRIWILDVLIFQKPFVEKQNFGKLIFNLFFPFFQLSRSCNWEWAGTEPATSGQRPESKTTYTVRSKQLQLFLYLRWRPLVQTRSSWRSGRMSLTQQSSSF